MYQLEAIRLEVLDAIEDIPDHLFNKSESQNTWSVKQVLEHLYKTEIEIIKAIHYMLSLPAQQPLPDQPLELSLDRTTKIKARTTIEPTSDLATKKEITSLLSQSREQLQHLVNSIPPELDLTTRGMKHPVFHILSLKQWIEFIGYHEKRHLAQIFEIKHHIINRSF